MKPELTTCTRCHRHRRCVTLPALDAKWVRSIAIGRIRLCRTCCGVLLGDAWKGFYGSDREGRSIWAARVTP